MSLSKTLTLNMLSCTALILSYFIVMPTAKGTAMASQKAKYSMIGQKDNYVVGNNGQPDVIKRFLLTDQVREFRISLLGKFTADQIASGSISIQEMTWLGKDGSNITLWLQETANGWIVVHELHWDASSDF